MARGVQSCTMIRIVRRFVLAVLLFVCILPLAVRFRSYLLVKRFDAVLAGLNNLRIDQTSEEQLLKTVPGLIRFDLMSPSKGYSVRISNEEEWRWVFDSPLAGILINPAYVGERGVRRSSTPVGTWFGFRFIDCQASVIVIDGRVSKLRYTIAWELAYHGGGDVVSVESAHGFWQDRHRPIRVTKSADRNLNYRVHGDDRFLGAIYTYDAPQQLISHAFQIDVSCFWGFRGCLTSREIAPALWRDNQAQTEAERLTGQNPCPERMLADRVRYLLDLDVELIELKGNHYQRKERIKEGPREAYTPNYPTPGAGNRLLYFSGANFESCQVVPATAAAEAAVRTVVPAPRRREDGGYRVSGLW